MFQMLQNVLPKMPKIGQHKCEKCTLSPFLCIQVTHTGDREIQSLSWRLPNNPGELLFDAKTYIELN